MTAAYWYLVRILSPPATTAHLFGLQQLVISSGATTVYDGVGSGLAIVYIVDVYFPKLLAWPPLRISLVTSEVL